LSAVNIDNPDLIRKRIDGSKHILVASWKADTSYYKPAPGSIYYNTGTYPIWVTLSPQLQQICSQRDFGAKVGL